MAHRIRGECEEAIADLTKSMELEPLNSQTAYERAEAHSQSNQFHESLADVERSLALSPDDPSAVGLKGWLLAHTTDSLVRNVTLGVTLLEKARDMSLGQNPQILQRLAEAQDAAGDLDQAIAAQRELIRFFERLELDKSALADFQATVAGYELKRAALYRIVP